MTKKVVKKASHKSKAPNLVIPILSISVLTTLAIALFLNRPRPVPIGINEVVGITSNCSQAGFTDNFESNTLNSNNWNIELNDPGENVESLNQQLVSTSPAGITGLRLFSKNNFVGDFSSTIDIKTPQTIGNIMNAKISYLAFRSPDQGNFVAIGRDGTGQIITYPVGGYYGSSYPNNYVKTVNIPQSQTVTVKVVREGTHYKTYYKTTSDFVLLGDYPDIGNEPVIARLNLGTGDADHNLATTDSKDNFSLSCITPDRPPTPANPRVTCNPDGKSVRAMWDTVDSAQSYKVRFDDKAGKVLSFDNITKGEYIATIVPGTTYSWWAHSSRDGVDSSETPRLEFKCTAVATPTPTSKPTVRPTAKPTVTPTVAPTKAPTNPSYVEPSTTTTQKISLPVEPSATPTPTKSTNPISRFFSWLASLFE